MGNLKHDRMHTSALATPGRHRHRPVTERDVEQPAAIPLPALRSLHLARWQIARHTISVSVVSCLDSCQSGPHKTETGTPMASPFETVAQRQCSTTVLECQYKNPRTPVRFR